MGSLGTFEARKKETKHILSFVVDFCSKILLLLVLTVAGVSGMTVFGAYTAEASSLYLSPAAGTYSVGAYFPVSVYVSSGPQAINAISNKVTFPSDKMQVTSLSKGGSIMNLWVQEPSFSNGDGSVDLAGVVLNPGFTGSSGKVMTINFKVISTGTGKVNMAEGSVLANDGNGTETLTAMSGAQFTFTPAIQQPKTPPPPEPVPITTPKPVVVTELDAPVIQKYTDSVTPTDVIFVQGTTQPNFTTRLFIENPGNRVKVAEAKADSSGSFVVTWDQHIAGSQSQATMYYMRLDAINSDGTRTTKMTNVLPVSVIARSLSQAVLLMVALGISILVIIILIIALLLALSRRKEEDNGNVKEDVKKAEALVQSTFDNLRKNLDYYTEVVESTSENRQLSRAEEVIVKRMERNLDEAEKTIESGIDTIGDKKK